MDELDKRESISEEALEDYQDRQKISREMREKFCPVEYEPILSIAQEREIYE
jgi:hypothetical protein